VDLRDVLHAVRRRWWLVVIATGLSVGLAVLLTALTVPRYATTVTFFITTPSQGVSDSYTGGLFSQQRVKSYADLLVGERLARSVASLPGINASVGQIQGEISAKAIPDTVLLQATVTDPDKARSQRIAAAMADNFGALVTMLETPAGGGSPTVKVEVVAGPVLNPVPVTPRPLRNTVLALVLGLLVGTGLAVLREILDVTIKTAESLRLIANAPVLAVVPFDPAAKQSPLVMEGEPFSARAEAFRHLRTNLQFVDVDHPVRTMVITSAVPEEGKSTTAVNLAIAFAEAGKRTLLIEGDLRRPRVAEYLGLERAIGLSNVLAGLVEVDEVIQEWGRHGLKVLPSGFVPPNPSEMLGSRNMAVQLGLLRFRFDVIIIDAPPLLPVTDAAIIAANVDGAVLVTRSGKTPQARVQTALASLRAVDSRVLGCVLNMQSAKSGPEYYYYDYKGITDTRRKPSPAPNGAVRSPHTSHALRPTSRSKVTRSG
jgi:capsular exopolysaccharide synthesis family protein